MNEIEEFISHYLAQEKALLSKLDMKMTPNRMNVIQSKFKTVLEEHSPWLLSQVDFEKIDHTSSETDLTQKVEEIILRITQNPNEKTLHLNNYLQQFSDISGEDRTILIERFKTLGDEDLKKELMDLIEIFG